MKWGRRGLNEGYLWNEIRKMKEQPEKLEKSRFLPSQILFHQHGKSVWPSGTTGSCFYSSVIIMVIGNWLWPHIRYRNVFVEKFANLMQPNLAGRVTNWLQVHRIQTTSFVLQRETIMANVSEISRIWIKYTGS